ncbi:MAG: hypothetical protein Q9214_005045, partial [Letrouitia sp. 1 TL-2023]
MDDPCQWSVDQVVDALCNPNATFRTSADPGQRPDPNFLEVKLREQYIDGTTLLTDVDLKSLKEDIGIQQLGPRSTILREIKRLRRQSRTYSKLRRQSLSAEPSFASEDIGHPIWNGITPSDSRNYSTAAFADDIQSFMKSPPKSPETRLTRPESRTTPHHGIGDQTSSAQENTSQGYKSPKSSAFLAQDVQLEPATSGSSSLGDVPESTSVPGPSNETRIVDETGRERRRIVLKQPEMTILRQNSLVDEASLGQPTDLASLVPGEKGYIADNEIRSTANVDASTHNNLGDDDSISTTRTIQCGPAQQSSIEMQIPRSTTTDERGRKRIVPVLISQSQHNSTNYHAESPSNPEKESLAVSSRLGVDLHNKNADGKSSVRRPDQTYLGFRALPVDSIFYGDNSKQEILAKESNSDDDVDGFTFSTFGRFSDGQRRYVNSRLNYFYKSTIQSLVDRDRNVVEQIPYPSEVARTHRSLFMTIYQNTPEGVVASKVNRPGNLARISDAPKLDGSEENVFATKHTANADDIDWDYLEKWNSADGVNTVLPVYGDSGSEGQYDLETWREMEAEQGSKIDRPLYRSRRKKLEIQQVINAVDGEIGHL